MIDPRKLEIDKRREVQKAFRSYNGNLNSRQKEILGDYGIVYEKASNNHFVFKYRGRQIAISCTPGDWRVGRNLATKLINLLNGDPISF